MQLIASCHIGRLDLPKVVPYVSSNLGIIMTEIVGFYGLTVTVDLLPFLLIANFGMWADFSGIENLT